VAAVLVLNTPDDGRLRPKHVEYPAEMKPAQFCIKLVFHLTYTMMHGSTKLKCTVNNTWALSLTETFPEWHFARVQLTQREKPMKMLVNQINKLN
jgi:hypothetical protein